MTERFVMVRIHPLRKLALALVAGAGFAIAAGAAQAEDLDRVVDKLDRVERDLRELQYEVYKGHPPATQGATGAPLAPANATRINDLEASLQELRGQVETMAFQMRQMQEQLELARKETNFRLGALEGGAPATALPQPALAAPAAAPSAPRMLNVSPNEGGSGSAGRSPGSLGTLPADDVQDIQPALSPRQQYDASMELLSRAQYVEAQSAFKAFVAANPKDELAGMAQFWAGEIAFTQKDYKGAVTSFADVLKRFPKTPKAPDAMLKLGLSLLELNQKKEACTTLGAVKQKFPKAPKPILDRAAKRYAEAKCTAG
jgi:tol-pal system protein YbgF